MTASIPLNFVTRPGVALTPACFANNRFEENSAEQCISNLLAVGFGKWVIDLYWDAPRRIWSLCPVEMPGPGVGSGPISSPGALATSASTDHARVTQLASRQVYSNELGSSIESLAPYMTKANAPESSTTTTSSSPTTVTISTSISANNTFLVVPTSAPNSETLYANGQYVCSRNVNLALLTSVLDDFLKTTDNTLQAFLYYFTLNLHSAAPIQAPNDLPSTVLPEDLPVAAELLSSIFNTNFSVYLYTPTLLAEQRQNLNISWFNVPKVSQPDVAYLDLQPVDNTNDVMSTTSFPNQAFLGVDGNRRLLLGSGTVDHSMQGYNFTGDSGTIFQDDIFQTEHPVTFANDGSIASGCYFNTSTTSITTSNSSWAVFSDLPALSPATFGARTYNTSTPLLTSLSLCGISPFLNQTLLNTTADIDIEPYLSFLRSTVWSWAYAEPAVYTDPSYRCAVLDTALSTSTSDAGRWHVGRCSSTRRAACRQNGAPHVWTISGTAAPYTNANATCPPNTTFAVPRTSLENAYLFSALRSATTTAPSSSNDDADTAIFLNYNSIDTEGCWVVGAGSKCPYAGTGGGRNGLAVPVVAGVVILVLAALTLVVKCAGNRSVRRRKGLRDGDGRGEWEYEGVPA